VLKQLLITISGQRRQQERGENLLNLAVGQKFDFFTTMDFPSEVGRF